MEHYAGVDLHKRVTQLGVLREGKASSPYRFPNDPSTVKRILRKLPRGTKMALEATGSWWWFVEKERGMLRTIILVGIYTGLRIRSEALTLRWEDIDLRRNLLSVAAAYAKSGEARVVPLNSIVQEALGRLKASARGEFVFSKPDGSPYRSFRTVFENACKRANISGVTLHTLRHTFASRLTMAAVDLRTIQELGGWRNLEMVLRYSHLSPSHKAEAVERIADHFPTLFTTPEKSAAAAGVTTSGFSLRRGGRARLKAPDSKSGVP